MVSEFEPKLFGTMATKIGMVVETGLYVSVGIIPAA